MKIKAQTLVMALEALKEREKDIKARWISEADDAKAELLRVKKNTYQEARIELEIKLAGITTEIEVTE